jgi:hypothetical protein
MASLVDEAVGHSREVVEARLAQAELDAAGPRMSRDVAVLEKQRPSVDAPLPGAQGGALWREYVAYWEKRFAELEQGRAVEGPLRWEGYEKMRGLFARGLAFERFMVSLLRADAALPRAMRRFLQDFNSPRIETNVGVAKQGTEGVRFADVLVIEEQPPAGQPPRVETFSFKSRYLAPLKGTDLNARIEADALAALDSYGGELDIRRRSLKQRVEVQRVRLVYQGGILLPKELGDLKAALDTVKEDVKGVEVLFQ